MGHIASQVERPFLALDAAESLTRCFQTLWLTGKVWLCGSEDVAELGTSSHALMLAGCKSLE
jgi:hypothetical protein